MNQTAMRVTVQSMGLMCSRRGDVQSWEMYLTGVLQNVIEAVVTAWHRHGPTALRSLRGILAQLASLTQQPLRDYRKIRGCD